MGPATTWKLPSTLIPDTINYSLGEKYLLSIISSTAAVSATITLVGTNDQISVYAASNTMVGVYYAQLSVDSPDHGKIFTSTFKVTINPCIVTSYSLTGCSYLGYILLDPPKNDSCIKITQVPSCQYDSTVDLTGVLSSIMTASVSNKDTVNTVILFNSDNTLAKTYSV